MDTTQETRYHRELRATLDQVVELLDKQVLVKELSSKQATHQQGLVETLVVRQQAEDADANQATTSIRSPPLWMRPCKPGPKV
jgi:hypothetical protein